MASESSVQPISTAQTLVGIFFSPARVFESFRERPRFLVAALIVLASIVFLSVLFLNRVGYERVIRSTIEASPQAATLTPELRERAIGLYLSPLGKAITYGKPIIATILGIAAGAAIYLLGSFLAKRTMHYKQALAVWTYSSLPPTIITTLLGVLILFSRSAKDIDPMTRGTAIVRTNLSMLVDPSLHPMLAVALRSFDLFAFYGLFLAALGLRKTARIQPAISWAIVLVPWIIGLLFDLARAALLKS
jgi:amino acid transporter